MVWEVVLTLDGGATVVVGAWEVVLPLDAGRVVEPPEVEVPEPVGSAGSGEVQAASISTAVTKSGIRGRWPERGTLALPPLPSAATDHGISHHLGNRWERPTQMRPPGPSAPTWQLGYCFSARRVDAHTASHHRL